MAQLLHFSKDPLMMNGPEAIAYLDILAAEIHNKLAAFREQIEVALAAGNATEVESLAVRITEYETYRQPIARLRNGVYEDFPNDFLPSA